MSEPHSIRPKEPEESWLVCYKCREYTHTRGSVRSFSTDHYRCWLLSPSIEPLPLAWAEEPPEGYKLIGCSETALLAWCEE